MITLVFVLLAAAVVLLIVEAFIPDFGICGILGIVSFVGAAVITALFIPFGIYFVLCEIAAFGVFAYFIYKFILKRRFQGRIVLNDTVQLSEPDFNPADLLGKEGVTTTPLKPTGFADFNGTIIEVYSEGEFIHKRSRVKVIDCVNNRPIVRLLKEVNAN